jgi:hypothetical protein
VSPLRLLREKQIGQDQLFEEETREPDERTRLILADATLTFSDLTGCRAAWEPELESWNVMKSEVLEELREMVRNEAHAE